MYNLPSGPVIWWLRSQIQARGGVFQALGWLKNGRIPRPVSHLEPVSKEFPRACLPCYVSEEPHGRALSHGNEI
jgi:hypothetical protein